MGVIQQSVNQMLGTAALAATGIEKATERNLEPQLSKAKTDIENAPLLNGNFGVDVPEQLKEYGLGVISEAEKSAAQKNIIGNISAGRKAERASGIAKDLNDIFEENKGEPLTRREYKVAINKSRETISSAVERHNNIVDFFSDLKGAENQTFYKFGKGGDK